MNSNNKLQLPTVTLMCIDCVDVTRAIAVVEHCKTLCDFGAVKVLTSLSTDYDHIKIMPLNSLVQYSIFMLTECSKYIDTDHVLIVQRDGWILNTNAWENTWLQYDYLAPVFNQYDIVGSGGFSLRSKRLMDTLIEWMPKWDGTPEGADEIQSQVGYYEDGVIAFSEELRKKYNYAPIDVANKFAQGGNMNTDNYYEFPFGFHGSARVINHETGSVGLPSECEHDGLCGCTHKKGFAGKQLDLTLTELIEKYANYNG
jgi:hypothetical protein